MKINSGAIIINTLFTAGAIVAPRIIPFGETAWMSEKPACISEPEWVLSEKYTWQPNNQVSFGPDGTPHFKIKGTQEENKVDIQNVSGVEKEYVLHNPDDPERKWLHHDLMPSVSHRVKLTSPSVDVYYKK